MRSRGVEGAMAGNCASGLVKGPGAMAGRVSQIE